MKIPVSALGLAILTFSGLALPAEARPHRSTVVVSGYRGAPAYSGHMVRYHNHIPVWGVRPCPPPVRYCPPPVRYCPPPVVYCPPRPIPYVVPGVVFQATFTSGYPNPAPAPPVYRYDEYRGSK